MKFPPIKVQYADGREHEANCKPLDIVEFERKFGTLTVAMEAPGIEHLAYLAFVHLHRTGKAPGEFDEWLATVDDLELMAEPDPTLPALAAG